MHPSLHFQTYVTVIDKDIPRANSRLELSIPADTCSRGTVERVELLLRKYRLPHLLESGLVQGQWHLFWLGNGLWEVRVESWTRLAGETAVLNVRSFYSCFGLECGSLFWSWSSRCFGFGLGQYIAWSWHFVLLWAVCAGELGRHWRMLKGCAMVVKMSWSHQTPLAGFARVVDVVLCKSPWFAIYRTLPASNHWLPTDVATARWFNKAMLAAAQLGAKVSLAGSSASTAGQLRLWKLICLKFSDGSKRFGRQQKLIIGS